MPTTLISPLNAKVGIKRESTYATEASGDYRGLPVISWESNQAGSTRTAFKKIQAIQGDRSGTVGGTHYEVSFSFCAGGTDADQATLIDIIDMIYGADTVTGAGPFTHTFNVANSNIKPSWSLYMESGDAGEVKVWLGFVATSVEIEVNKTGNGLVIVNVTGMAASKEIDAGKTVDFTVDYAYWSINTAIVKSGAVQMDEFESATILLETLGNAKQVISGTKGAIAVTVPTMDASIALEGPWNSGTPTVQQSIQTSWESDSDSATDITIEFGSDATDNYYTLTFPSWTCVEFSDPPLEADAEDVRFSATIKNIHNGATAQQHNSVILSTDGTDWDTL